MTALTAAAVLALATWLYLLLGHGRLWWRADQRLPAETGGRESWPPVAAVIPARNEAPFVGRAVASLVAQDYPGELKVVLVDDDSSDGTADAARAAAREAGAEDRLTIVAGAPLPEGWTGKMWAVSRGVAHASEVMPEAGYLLLTDADIVHGPGALRRLVDKAEQDRLDLVSLMVLLHCRGGMERLLIPAFVFFFQMLYPFPWVNDPRRGTAGAAGGCMLVRRAALTRAGGIEAIRGEIIDDCALARRIKSEGPIWLGLAEETRSVRPYAGLDGIWHMVARTAFTQLRYSAVLLAGTALGMILLYLVPLVALLTGLATGGWAPALAGIATWLVMALAYAPTLRLYREPAAAAFLLPAAGVLYALMTVDSARRHWGGRGGAWKGRTYAAK
ncbi:MAG: glycosyltransferase [Alphaproteobacteria bacterium]|nr:glycosyltransferase [Alphaproteobacteria bacterium]